MTHLVAGPIAIAQEAWGATMPDWVARLAAECEATSQNAVAKRLNRSASLISTVLRAKYPGDMAAVEDLVRGALMSATIVCPVLGDLPTHICRSWRDKAKHFAGHNALRVTMFRACHRCPRNKAEPS